MTSNTKSKKDKLTKKEYFEPVNLSIDFTEAEKELLNGWYEKGVVDKYLHKNDSSDKYFSFLDGPITANNPMGVHHGWGRTYKDLWQKYKNMKGYKQRFQNGFDCQGLWVEVEVEKELGFKNKKDIEKYGVAKFVDHCKERVKKYSQIQTEQSKRLGYFADWKNSYYTLSEDNNYMIWRFLKKVHDNGWLYKGADSVPWCPRCETAISQHEMLTEDYKEVVHESIYVKFPIKNKENEHLLVWTTTPWTIPANIAVAVDEKLFYVLVQIGKESYWLADEAKDRVLKGYEFNILKKVKGKELLGISYKGAFDGFPAVMEVAEKNPDTFHKVIPTDSLIMPITAAEGTGLVHTAVSAGSEDFQLGQKLGLPMIPVINDDASYKEGFDFLSGKNAKDQPRLVLDFMENNNFSFLIENYKHRYPACWRCKSELVWKVTDEWYVSMDKSLKNRNSKSEIRNENPMFQNTNSKKNNKSQDTNHKTLRERMVDVAKQINWIPGFGLDRELDWLTNMHDWLISKKNRYWGLALPIWECEKCGNFDVIGSREELKEKAIEGWEGFEGKTPHKPQIDKIKIKCQACGGTSKRIEAVGNPWLDAGIVSYSTVSKNNEASNFEKSETKPLYLSDKEEWEKWIPASFITESFPGQFKNWFYSLIAMSTVMENIKPFKTVLGFATLLDETGRPMHKSWGNSIEFNEGAEKIGVDVMRWMYARQNPTDNLLFGYNVANEVRRNFHLKLWNTYNYFVTYANLNNWTPDIADFKIKKLKILDSWILWRLKETEDSVSESLDSFAASKGALSLEDFLNDLSNWYLRRSRDRAAINYEDKEGQDAFFSTFYFVLETLSLMLAPFTPYISEMIYKNLSKNESVHLENWPDLSKLPQNNKLGENMTKIRQFVEKIHSIRKEKGIPVRQPLQTAKLKASKSSFSNELLKIIAEEVNIKNIEIDEKLKKDIDVDTKITDELLEEARLREYVRKIQNERKNLGVLVSDYVNVEIDWKPKDKKLLEDLKKATLAKEVKIGNFKVSKI